MTGEGTSAGAVRRAAVGGALVGAGCAVLTAAAVAVWTPGLLATLLGPPPLPAALALASVPTGAIAGALVGRRALRTSGAARGRLGRIALASGLAYLGAVTAAVVALSLAAEGLVGLAFPFELVARGLSLSLVLAPWAALPVLGAALAVERLTRPPVQRPRTPGVGAIPPPRA